MKKLFNSKNKLFLAVISVAIILSMVFASTYAWFVATRDSNIVGGKADLEAANIGVTQTSYQIGYRPITLYHSIDKVPTQTTTTGIAIDTVLASTDNIKQEDVQVALFDNDLTQVPAGWTYASPDVGPILPGEGLRFFVKNDPTPVTITNNRDVVVEVDFNALLSGFGGVNTMLGNWKDAAAAVTPTAADDSDIYFQINNTMDTTTADWAYSAGNKYYLYIPANAANKDIDLMKYLEKITLDVGIVGLNRNQNHYMTKAVTLDLSNSDLSVNVTAVQATRQAVIDTFGKVVQMQFSELRTVEDNALIHQGCNTYPCICGLPWVSSTNLDRGIIVNPELDFTFKVDNADLYEGVAISLSKGSTPLGSFGTGDKADDPRILTYPGYTGDAGEINSGCIEITLYQDFLKWLSDKKGKGAYTLEIIVTRDADGEVKDLDPAIVNFILLENTLPGNFISNGNFAGNSKTGWSNDDRFTVYPNTDPRINADYVARSTGNHHAQVPKIEFSLQANTVYRLSLWGKVENSGSSEQRVMIVPKGESGGGRNYLASIYFVNAETDWTYKYIEFLVTEDTDVEFTFTAWNGTLHIADVKCEAVDTGNLIANGDFTCSTNYFSEWKTGAWTGHLNSIILGGGPNGENAGRRNLGWTGNTMNSNNFSLVTGETYTLSFWYRLPERNSDARFSYDLFCSGTPLFNNAMQYITHGNWMYVTTPVNVTTSGIYQLRFDAHGTTFEIADVQLVKN